MYFYICTLKYSALTKPIFLKCTSNNHKFNLVKLIIIVFKIITHSYERKRLKKLRSLGKYHFLNVEHMGIKNTVLT